MQSERKQDEMGSVVCECSVFIAPDTGINEGGCDVEMGFRECRGWTGTAKPWQSKHWPWS